MKQLESWLGERLKLVGLAAVLLTLIMAGLLFDTRLTFATDDATYIANALNVIQNGAYPTYQGALYPFVVAAYIKMFGVKVLGLKFLSLLFMVATPWVLFKALKNRVGALALTIGLLCFAVNPYSLVYGSSTFTESFFMLIQALSLWAFFKMEDGFNKRGDKLGKNIAAMVVFGVAFLALSITKNVALFSLGSVVVYYILERKWLRLVQVLAVVVVVKLGYEVGVRTVIDVPKSSQIDQLVNKRHDNPAEGKESTAGFVGRFTTNFSQYVSIHLFKIFGLRPGGEPQLYHELKSKELQAGKLETKGILNVIFLLVYGGAIYGAVRSKNRVALYLLLYIGALSAITFLIQTYWNQDRYMIIFIPILTIGLIEGLKGMVGNAKNAKNAKGEPQTSKAQTRVHNGVTALFLLLFLLQFGKGVETVGKMKGAYKHALKGDELYGYTIDAAEMLKAARWAGTTLDTSKIIACARNREAAVFGQSLQFVKMPRPKSTDAEGVIKELKDQKITHVLGSSYAGDGSVETWLQLAEMKAVKLVYDNKLSMGRAVVVELP